MKHKTTVLLVDDHLVVRMGLATIIGIEKDLAVIGQAGNGLEAVCLARELHPDVIVMDLMMPELNGAEATARIIADNPAAKILLLTTFGDSEDLRQAMEAGAIGALVKDSTDAELIDAIRQTAAGVSVVCPDIKRVLEEAVHTPKLTRRQTEILTYAAQGLITNAIAEKIGIGSDCVKAHLRTAFAILGASSRSEAVAIAMRKHLLKIKTLAVTFATAAMTCTGAVEYHVNNETGNDGNDGQSAARAFRTLAKATSVLCPGDTLVIAPGETYRESLVLRRSGTAAAPITIRGNGAVLSGLEPIPDESWTDCGDGIFFSANKACWGALVPRVVDRNGQIITVASHRSVKSERSKTLKSGEAIWNAEGVWYRVRQGESPVGAGLRGYFRESGVKIENCSHVVIERLTAEHFANDGFNVHGACHDLTFRQIEARWNGDDGFSVHEDGETLVCGGYFHNNGDGIADVHRSRTFYCDVRVEENEAFGIGFYGGMHSLRDAVVRHNGGNQVQVYRDADHGNRPEGASPLYDPTVCMDNIRIEGGPTATAGLLVDDGATVCADNCAFSDADIGLRLDGGKTRIRNTRVSQCRHIPILQDKAASLDGNPSADDSAMR